MEKNLFVKKRSNAKRKKDGGDENYTCYKISNYDREFSIAENTLVPHVLIVFWQIGNKKIIKGFYNNKSIDLSNNNEEVNEEVEIIVNSKDKGGVEIIASYREDNSIEKLTFNEIYNKKFTASEKHKLIIFNENKYFTEGIIYDSEISMAPCHLGDKEYLNRISLRNLLIAILGSYVSDIYKIISKLENED